MSSDERLIAPGAISDYLRCTDTVDFDDEVVIGLADFLAADSETDVLRNAFEFVRDRFPHSMDAGLEGVPCSASDVVRAGHGLCYAKSHLLAALLRYHRIPTGFCYQRLSSDNGFVLHTYNAARAGGRWIRVDARGNNDRVRVDFNPGGDMRAFRADEDAGECDYDVVFFQPDAGVVRFLRDGAGRKLSELKLPSDLSCPL